MIVAGSVGWFAGPTVAGTSSKHVAAKVKAPGLTGAERRAIQIVSVSAAGDDSSGLVVTVKFKGNVQDLLGQGHLKRGLVALVLEPKAAGATPTGVVDEGGGSFRQHAVAVLKRKHGKKTYKKVIQRIQAPEKVLSNTGSPDVGAVRDGSQLIFFVAGVKPSTLRGIEVEAFARAPGTAGGAADIAADGIPDWREILKKKPTDLGQLGVDPSKLSCDQLKALRAEISSARDFLEIELHNLEARQQDRREELEFHSQWPNRFLHWVFGPSGSPSNAEIKASLHEQLAKLAVEIDHTKAEIANLDKLLNQIDELLKKCAPTSTGTAMGSLSNGSGSALAYSVQTNTTANAFELILPTGTSVIGTSTPSGFSCSNNGNKEVCAGGSVQPNTPVTGSFNHTGAIAANCGCVQVAFSPDNGATWSPNPPATLTGPPSDSPSSPPSQCSGHAQLANIYGGQAHQLVADFTCPKSSTGFSLILPSGYQFTSGQASNNMTSNAYTCTESATNGPNDTVNCSGTVPPNSTSYVQTGTSPNPVAGMNLQFHVSFTDGSTASFTVISQ